MAARIIDKHDIQIEIFNFKNPNKLPLVGKKTTIFEQIFRKLRDN